MSGATLTAKQLSNPAPANSVAPNPVAIDESTPTGEFIRWTLERFANQRMVITTSFGMEGCSLIDMYASQIKASASSGKTSNPIIDVVYLDTGFFFPETYDLRDRMVTRYPQLNFVNHGTTLTPDEQEALYGPNLWRGNPDLCCKLRKEEPMSKALANVDVWISGITRSQSPRRATVRLIEWDFKFDLIKVSPLVNWTRDQVWTYVRKHDVPYNELHERGYPTLGCMQCTEPVPGASPTTYSRLGRWSGTKKTECGIHLPDIA